VVRKVRNRYLFISSQKSLTMAVTPTEASVEELDQLLNSFPRSDADRDKFLRYQHVLYQQRLEGALAKLTQEITEAGYEVRDGS
jgi:hypothetical protein